MMHVPWPIVALAIAALGGMALLLWRARAESGRLRRRLEAAAREL